MSTEYGIMSSDTGVIFVEYCKGLTGNIGKILIGILMLSRGGGTAGEGKGKDKDRRRKDSRQTEIFHVSKHGDNSSC